MQEKQSPTTEITDFEIVSPFSDIQLKIPQGANTKIFVSIKNNGDTVLDNLVVSASDSILSVVELKADQVVIQPGEVKQVGVLFSVPENAEEKNVSGELVFSQDSFLVLKTINLSIVFPDFFSVLEFFLFNPSSLLNFVLPALVFVLVFFGAGLYLVQKKFRSWGFVFLAISVVLFFGLLVTWNLFLFG